MSRFVIVVVLFAAVFWPLERASAQPPKAPDSAAAKRAELSYALGYQAGIDLANREPDVDIGTVLRGVQDGYSRKHPEYSPQQMRMVITTMEHRMVAQARTAFEKLAASNLQKSKAFFAANGKKQGVITLPSGVQYKVLGGSSSRGKSPTLASQVTLQFRSSFPDGTVFMNTADLHKPVVFPVDQMIPGWRQIILRMHVGDHWKVFVPPDQAYGIRGWPPLIGPNQALIFDLRLMSVKP